MSSLSYLEASTIGLMQGVTELFPVSSLGHSVIIPALIGGKWAQDLDVSASKSPYLSFVVGLHVATAIALVIFFWRDWVRVVHGLFTSIRDRQIVESEQRLAWMLIVGTIPVGLVGLLAEHPLRTTFGTPLSASIFLMINGLVLFGAERLRERADETVTANRPRHSARSDAAAAYRRELQADMSAPQPYADENAAAIASDHRLATLGMKEAVIIGAAQIGALFAGLSRSGLTISTGLLRGLSNEDAARFAFLLATPVILAAGVLKLPDLAGPLGKGIHGQVLVGSILSGVAAYVSVRFLTRYFETRTLRPFAVYCLVAGALCAVRFGLF